jgi:hypothetical protein
LHRGAFTQWSFYTHTQTRLHRGAFTHKSAYTQQAFAHKRLGAFTQRSLYQRALTHSRVYTQKLLHREAFTQRVFTHGNFYTQRNLYTNALSHRGAFTHRRKLLHKEVFTLYTEKLLHTKAFTQRSLCTEAPLHEVTSWNWQPFFRKTRFRELTCSPKKKQICSKKPEEYISEAGPHSIAFKLTLWWNRGPSSPAEPTMSVSSNIYI